jgi:signal transduction histidine kinase
LPLPAWFTLLLVGYFVAVQAYVALRFVRGSRESTGVTRQRLRAASLGALVLGLTLLAAGIAAVVPVVAVLSPILTLLAALAYAAAFATPSFLRQAWQHAELRAFLDQAGSLSSSGTAALAAELERAITKVAGARGATIALFDEGTGLLRVSGEALDPAQAGALGRAFREQRPVLVENAPKEFPALVARFREIGAVAVLAAPVTSGTKRLGALRVYASRPSIFVEDDLALVALLARQTALLLEGARSAEATKQLSSELANRLDEVRLLNANLNEKTARLAVLNSTGIALSAEHSSELVLQKIADLSRAVAGARYAALGVFDDDGRIVQFWTSGITAEERARIGPLPEGRGILGLLQTDPRPLRLADLKDHPASVAFPANHPPMHSFLGVPVIWRKRVIGNLYLTEKINAAEFSEEDEQALITLAAQAAVAIENARLYEQEGHMARMEERHRIGMDLHDGVMQTLYGVALLIEGAAVQIGDGEVAEDLGRAVDRLNAAIADLRSYVLELRPIRGSDRPLSDSLPEVARQVAANALLRVDLDISAECDRLLTREQREAVFYVAADGMGNVARHARASSLGVRLSRNAHLVVLEISDDGVGFDGERAVGGLGLRNMRERAFAVGGMFHITTAPGAGTRIRFELPSEAVARS